MAPDDPVHHTLRGDLRERANRLRAGRTPRQRADEDRARTARTLTLASRLAPVGSTIACYLSAGHEPSTLDLIGSLLDGHRILVPDLRRPPGARGVPSPNWAPLADLDEITDGPFNIPGPTRPGLGPAVLSQADLVIASALQAGTDGSRLGTGGGWYDRALVHARPGVPIVVLLNDDEIAPCPMAAHDRYVDWIITPTRTVQTTR